MAEFDPERVLASLGRHGVRFIVIGGMAGSLHGSPHTTFDLDVTPERSAENLGRLARALRELQARVRTQGVEDGLPLDCSAEFLERVDMLNLVTSAGDVDISFQPSGTTGYADLVVGALTVEVRGTRFAVASLEDIIRSKRAANRPKDRLVLPTLQAMLDRRPDPNER